MANKDIGTEAGKKKSGNKITVSGRTERNGQHPGGHINVRRGVVGRGGVGQGRGWGLGH